MSDWSTLGLGQRWQSSAPTNSRGTTVTPSATAHTKGSYAQLFSAAANTTEASGVLVTLVSTQAGGQDALVDLAIGAAASEVVIASNLFCTNGDVAGLAYQFYLPIAIPSGTRISARCQSAMASAAAVQVSVSLMAQGFLPSSPLQRITSYGPNTATSGGVSLDPGGSANTKGAWSQLSASTTNDCRLLYIVPGIQNNQAPTTAQWLIDIGIGAAGSEIGVGGSSATTGLVNLPFRLVAATNWYFGPTVIGPLSVQIPAGTRLSARCQCSITDATDRLIEVALYGID